MSDNRNNIRVVCRFRPQNSRERREGGIPIIKYDDNGDSCRMEGKEFQGNFTFDRIFQPETQQKFFFDESIKPIVDDVIKGYNGTVFAYGQTGSGKTHTMMGDMDYEEYKGLIPRIVEQIFHSNISSPSTTECTVKASYMEIYMEKIRDLLNPKNDNLPIREKKNRVYVKDLLEIYVGSVQELYEVIRRGGNSRIVAYTDMNTESSRSHSILVITVNQKNLNDGSVKSGKLLLVDLADFEKVGKIGQTLEVKKVNKSLSALGIVINALVDGKSTHIPYRDSKLTRILQESLGGNSRTTLIINCSPSSFDEAETLRTLRFGMRAKNIKNKARVNVEFSITELKVLLKKAKNEAVSFEQYTSTLEGEVGVWRSGGTVPKEKWASVDEITSEKDERDHSRPGTPSPILEEDEREEFLKLENELADQICEIESALAAQEKILVEMNEELDSYEFEKDIITKMESELSELKVQLYKVVYENKEGGIIMDTLRESNLELSTEVESLKKALAQKEVDKEQKKQEKQEKMAAILAGLDLSGVIFGEMNNDNVTIMEELTLRRELSDSKNLVLQHEQTINELYHENEHLTRKRDELEILLTTLELDYEELLGKIIDEDGANNNIDITETITELRSKLEAQFVVKKEVQQKEIDELKQELEKKNEELRGLNSALADLKRANEELQNVISKKESKAVGGQKNVAEKEKDMERICKTMSQQLADFDAMKKALIRDLQNRCEKKVVELDETREQYNNVLRNSNNKAQQKKIALLERSLEQLTNEGKQLVKLRSSLKKEIDFAERKLLFRNERIQALEVLLKDEQEKLITQNQRFEAQLQVKKTAYHSYRAFSK
ncbi:kinesin-domain-containing protein [Rhizophagus irregularis]|uniref:Kinesin-domain-containing protein n=1 Tax=Rhizophagus irregularis TaxID=588596 RepID=A0A2I1HDH8_9GLOM|nr:kinesin-domain-containing protein [Rhizophagus irregularis]